MAELPVVTGKQAIKALEHAGFHIDRISKGSHHVMKRPGHRFVVTVPVHGARDLKPGTLRGIIQSAGLSVDEFIELLNR